MEKLQLRSSQNPSNSSLGLVRFWEASNKCECESESEEKETPNLPAAPSRSRFGRARPAVRRTKVATSLATYNCHQYSNHNPYSPLNQSDKTV